MTNSENNDLKEVQREANTYEDGINLMDYIQVIIKRKKLILSIFFIAVISTAIVSLLLPRVYKAEASIMIMPSKIQSPLSPARISLNPEKTEQGEYVATQKPTISIPTHKALLKSNAVLQRVMNKLKSTGELDEDLALEELSKKLEVVEDTRKSESKDTMQTNILQLAAKDKKPGLAKDIVNIWADEYTLYSLGIITGEIQGSGDFVVKQFGLAEGELVKAEQALKDFDVEERLSLMEIELKENISQLESHDANVLKLDFTLKEKENLLKKTDDDIAALTKDGIWIGAFSVKIVGEKYFTDETLTNKQKTLRQKALTAKLDLENNIEKHNNFVNDSKIMLLKAELEQKRTNIVNDKTRLAQIRQLSESTKANLNSEVNLDTLKELGSPIAENLPELTIWEILSLTEGYNFFETCSQSLASKLEQQEKEIKELEKVVFVHNDALKTLVENLDRAQVNYDFYYGQLKALQNRKNSLEVDIAKLEFEFSYSSQMVKKLEGLVKTLKVAINEKKTKTAELNRQQDIAQKAYTSLASKIEEARIAKAMELGEVKVVSTAFEPEYPIAPKKKLIVAVAGVVSLMLSVFIAFCLEFWQKDKYLKQSQVQPS
jgi:uncharacterized protein involved in exopolysaccharide biosynthesis